MLLARRLALPLALFAPLALVAACAGAGSGSHSPVTPSESACVCGTPAGDLHGCLDDLCLAQVGNPQNPDCFCAARTRAGGTVELGPTSTSFVSVSLEQSLDSIRMLELADGTKVRGKVLADEGGLVRFQSASGDVVEYERAELSPRSHYSLEKARVEDGDGAGQLELARLAAECGLL
ncbi:MAG TPA: hypothetical protein VJP77_02280, partial [Planctomycetota bacterium]|nr:hypothetical protein [Planctomycetota bacterium]